MNEMGRRDKTLRSRFECKYLVAPSMVPAIRRYIRPFVEPDAYARQRPGFSYPICSLYLDGPGLPLMRATEEGWRNRFKLRLRSYPAYPQAPVFVEVKRRVDGIVSKLRVGMTRAETHRLLERHRPGSPVAPAAAEFLRLVGEIDARPIVRVLYEREAYEARGNEPVRLTFDSALLGSATPGLDLGNEGTWHSGRRPRRRARAEVHRASAPLGGGPGRELRTASHLVLQVRLRSSSRRSRTAGGTSDLLSLGSRAWTS